MAPESNKSKRGGGVGIAQEKQNANELKMTKFLCLQPPWRAAPIIFSGLCGREDKVTVFRHPSAVRSVLSLLPPTVPLAPSLT